jgi:putative ABC transport system substrate-binding protein
MCDMRRREFITLIGGAAATWALAVRAQQPTKPVIGFLRSTSLAVSTPMVTGFSQGLTAAGFTEGQNVVIESRYADNQRERLPGLVSELIRLPVAVIVANSRGQSCHHDGADRIHDRQRSGRGRAGRQPQPTRW